MVSIGFYLEEAPDAFPGFSTAFRRAASRKENGNGSKMVSGCNDFLSMMVTGHSSQFTVTMSDLINHAPRQPPAVEAVYAYVSTSTKQGQRHPRVKSEELESSSAYPIATICHIADILEILHFKFQPCRDHYEEQR